MNIAILSTDSALCIKLRRILNSLDKHFKIDAFDDLFNANQNLSIKPYALVFCDFRLSGSDEFELICPKINLLSKVIFITNAHHTYILNTSKPVFDYLITPITKAKVLQVFEKLSEYTLPIYINGSQPTPTITLNPSIILSSNYGFERINMEQIIKIEASKSYTIFYMLGAKKKVSTKNLGYYEKLLPDETFFRVHHHSIINALHIKSYHSSGMLELSSEIFQSVSKRKRLSFLSKFKRLTFNIS